MILASLPHFPLPFPIFYLQTHQPIFRKPHLTLPPKVSTQSVRILRPVRVFHAPSPPPLDAFLVGFWGYRRPGFLPLRRTCWQMHGKKYRLYLFPCLHQANQLQLTAALWAPHVPPKVLRKSSYQGMYLLMPALGFFPLFLFDWELDLQIFRYHLHFTTPHFPSLPPSSE
jgi:hypothetical protein